MLKVGTPPSPLYQTRASLNFQCSETGVLAGDELKANCVSVAAAAVFPTAAAVEDDVGLDEATAVDEPPTAPACELAVVGTEEGASLGRGLSEVLLLFEFKPADLGPDEVVLEFADLGPDAVVFEFVFLAPDDALEFAVLGPEVGFALEVLGPDEDEVKLEVLEPDEKIALLGPDEEKLCVL